MDKLRRRLPQAALSVSGVSVIHIRVRRQRSRVRGLCVRQHFAPMYGHLQPMGRRYILYSKSSPPGLKRPGIVRDHRRNLNLERCKDPRIQQLSNDRQPDNTQDRRQLRRIHIRPSTVTQSRHQLRICRKESRSSTITG